MAGPDRNKTTTEFNDKVQCPTLSCYEIFVLDVLANSEIKGADIRQTLLDKEAKKSEPAFSGTMKKLERLGLISSRFIYTTSNGSVTREKHFARTDLGTEDLSKAKKFFATLSGNSSGPS